MRRQAEGAHRVLIRVRPLTKCIITKVSYSSNALICCLD